MYQLPTVTSDFHGTLAGRSADGYLPTVKVKIEQILVIYKANGNP